MEKTISITILKVTVWFAVHLLLLALASERRRVASGTGSKQSFLVLLAMGIQVLMQRSLFRLVFNLVIVSESALPSLWISRVEEGSDSIAELLVSLRRSTLLDADFEGHSLRDAANALPPVQLECRRHLFD